MFSKGTPWVLSQIHKNIETSVSSAFIGKGLKLQFVRPWTGAVCWNDASQKYLSQGPPSYVIHLLSCLTICYPGWLQYSLMGQAMPSLYDSLMSPQGIHFWLVVSRFSFTVAGLVGWDPDLNYQLLVERWMHHLRRVDACCLNCILPNVVFVTGFLILLFSFQDGVTLFYFSHDPDSFQLSSHISFLGTFPWSKLLNTSSFCSFMFVQTIISIEKYWLHVVALNYLNLPLISRSLITWASMLKFWPL